MIDADYIELVCLNFRGNTYGELARSLRVHRETLYRVRMDLVAGKQYSRIRPSANRKIPCYAFPTIQETCRQIQNRKMCG